MPGPGSDLRRRLGPAINVGGISLAVVVEDGALVSVNPARWDDILAAQPGATV